MRLFRCRACGHHMRFAGERCGRCLAEKPAIQTPSFLRLFTVSGAMGACVAGLAAYLIL